jgi:hypothetical protein
VARTLGLLVALLVVLLGLGSTWITSAPSGRSTASSEAAHLDDRTPAASVEQASDAAHSNGRLDRAALAVESDEDDCDEVAASPVTFTLSIARPTTSFDSLPPNDIRPSQGHGAGPEKPPRA